jgi:hypothetical protein
MNIEITWSIEYRTEHGEWKSYDTGPLLPGPTESFLAASSPPESDEYKRIIEWRLVKTTREVVSTKKRE